MDNVFFNKKNNAVKPADQPIVKPAAKQVKQIKQVETPSFSKITNTKNMNEIKSNVSEKVKVVVGKETVKEAIPKEVRVKKVYVKKEKKDKKDICVIPIKNAAENNGGGVPVFESNLEIPTKSPVNITKLNDLQFKKTYITEIVPLKKQTRNKISMIDIMSKVELDKEDCDSKYNCFWCKHPFKYLPLGCPIDFIPTLATKKYVSCINNDVYRILENIAETQIQKNNDLISYENRNYYTTDGIFCSFNCCQAYINDNSHLTLYKNSSSLLIKIYIEFLESTSSSELKSSETIFINPAPHWRSLSAYGGFLSIVEFRSSFNKIIYTLTGKSNSDISKISSLADIKTLPLEYRFEENIIF